MTLFLSVLSLTWASFSLLSRTARGSGDFSLFYRTALELRRGASWEVYQERDITGELRCLAPPGITFLLYMPWMSSAAAAAVWLVFNLGLLGLSAWCLWNLCHRLDRQSRLYTSTWPWALALLLVLSADGVQVGQFSVLFVTCWLSYLVVGNGFAGAALLMLPTAVKVYPALLWAVPVALRRYRDLLWLAPAGVLLGVLLPLLAFGDELPALWRGFVQYALPQRTQHMLRPWVESNQSLDNLLLRCLTDQPQFQAKYPYFPHLHLQPALVTHLIMLLKLGVLTATALAARRLASRRLVQPRWTGMTMLGLWSVSLVLLLPENKAPYIVYCFPAWLPVLAGLAARHRLGCLRPGHVMAVVSGVLSQVQLMPDSVRIYCPALMATIALWAALLRLSWRAWAARDG